MIEQTVENINAMSDEEMKAWIHRCIFGTPYRPAKIKPMKSFTEWAIENGIAVDVDDANKIMTEYHENNPLF